MKRAMKLTVLMAVLTVAACDSTMEPELAPKAPAAPNYALIQNGIAYQQVDAQFQRLYDFNNCMTGLPPYNQLANCQEADATYEAATYMNEYLAWVFDWGVTTTKAQALSRIDTYLWLVDAAIFYGRMSCRARFVNKDIATKLRAIVNAIVPGNPSASLASLPQPLTTPLYNLNQFAGSGCSSNVSFGLPFNSLNGYTLIGLNSTCGDTGPRTVEFTAAADTFYLNKSIHSNGSLLIAASDGVIYNNATYRCTYSNTGANNDIPTPGLVAGVLANPLASFNPASVPCTYTRAGVLNLDGNGPWWQGGVASSRILIGVICTTGATGHITLTLDDVSGNVMLKSSGRISITGDLPAFRSPHASGVVLYAPGSGTIGAGTAAITLNGMFHSYSGYVYAPSGHIDALGFGLTVNGAIVGNRVRISNHGVAIVTRD